MQKLICVCHLGQNQRFEDLTEPDLIRAVRKMASRVDDDCAVSHAGGSGLPYCDGRPSDKRGNARPSAAAMPDRPPQRTTVAKTQTGFTPKGGPRLTGLMNRPRYGAQQDPDRFHRRTRKHNGIPHLARTASIGGACVILPVMGPEHSGLTIDDGTQDPFSTAKVGGSGAARRRQKRAYQQGARLLAQAGGCDPAAADRCLLRAGIGLGGWRAKTALSLQKTRSCRLWQTDILRVTIWPHRPVAPKFHKGWRQKAAADQL